jgi:hypothetical protein
MKMRDESCLPVRGVRVGDHYFDGYDGFPNGFTPGDESQLWGWFALILLLFRRIPAPVNQPFDPPVTMPESRSNSNDVQEDTGMAKVVRFHEIGGPEVLRIEDVEVPPPGKGEVQIVTV